MLFFSSLCSPWHIPDIAQLEQPHPQEDLPCFLFFTSLTIIATTTPRRRIDIAIVARLFVINSITEPYLSFFYFFALTSPFAFSISEKSLGLAIIYTINAKASIAEISPNVLATGEITPKRFPLTSEPNQ